MGANQVAGLPAATPGTKTAMWINLAGTLLSGIAGISQYLPPQYAWIGAAIFGVNAGLHAVTGNTPVV